MEYGYKNKVAVVTGAASGMGKEVANLLLAEGAKVYALDMNEPDTQYEEFIELNLSSQESIDASVAKLPEKVDTIFACAGVAGKSMPELLVTKINFIGHYHLIERLIPRMNKNSSIGLIASMGGMGWIGNIPAVMEFLQNDTFEKQATFLESKTDDPRFLGDQMKETIAVTRSRKKRPLYTPKSVLGKSLINRYESIPSVPDLHKRL